jgi:hypothetical protein
VIEQRLAIARAETIRVVLHPIRTGPAQLFVAAASFLIRCADPSARSTNHDSLSSPSRRGDRMEAGPLSASLEKGEGYEETLPSYDSMMEIVRAARRDAQQVFSTADVQQKATAARGILNELSPDYDPDAVPLQPVMR